MERRELFSSLTSKLRGKSEDKKEKTLRPPYFLDEATFLKECIKCDGKCATFCEEQIIIIDDDKTPRLNFSKSGCTYCDECAKACDFGVLSLENRVNIDTKISINMLECLSWNSTMCFSCKDPCLEDAIIFLGMFRPEIDENRCTSCGFCISRCPTNAIKVG